MEVPSAVLQNLVCDNCENYLSRGPVLMLEQGNNRCGRCIEPEEGAPRNNAYEELAKLMTFPCRYKENGCEEHIPFDENQVHEDACTRRLYVCPVAASGQCDWSGVRGDFLEHCRLDHPDNVIGHPGQLRHNITQPSLGSYLMAVCQVLFLVQTKVCTVSRKIYHSVRLLGDPRLAANYRYDIDMANENGKLTRHGQVAPQGCLMLQEDSAVAVDINSLLTVLGGFKDTVFTLTVRSKDGTLESSVSGSTNAEGKSKAVQSQLDVLKRILKSDIGKLGNPSSIKDDEEAQATERKFHVKCVRCKSTTEPVLFNKGWLCKTCAPIQFACKNKDLGCGFVDLAVKSWIHFVHYCPFNNHCTICERGFSAVPRELHYEQAHESITHNADRYSTIHFNKEAQWCIINTDFGKVLCSYKFNDTMFDLSMMSPLFSHQLYKYLCIAEIKSSVTGLVFKRTSEARYLSFQDWYLRISREDLDPYIDNDNGLLIKFTFPKIVNLDQLKLM